VRGRLLSEGEAKEVLQELHSGLCGGHFSARTTTHKILRAGYYWPTLFSDTHAYFRSCESCQIFAGKRKLPALPLERVVVEAPFKQWGLDFVGEMMSENSSNGLKWI